MQRATKRKMAYSALVAALMLAGVVGAQDKKPADKPLEHSTLDESIYQSLRGIIDHGADLYNQGDWNGCYRLWEGALMGLKPLLGDRQLRSWAKPSANDNTVYTEALKGLQSQLGDRPALQNVIEIALSSARQTPQTYRRAFILRVALDQLRAETKPAKSTAAKGAKPNGASAKNGTLWDRLGGEAGVTKIVDDFVNLAAPDAKVDFFRHGKFQMTPEQVVKMKREIVEQISKASGGPLKYTGPDMKKVHKGMGITEAQFNAAAAHLKKALEKNNVAAEDVKKVLDAVGNYRKEIVEPKKTEEEKPIEKKEEKKPAGKASVTGLVTLKGQLLKGGNVLFTDNQGKVAGKIAADGTYKVEGLKPGNYKLSIQGAAVPAAFTNPNTSGLTYDVKEGEQNHDIALQ